MLVNEITPPTEEPVLLEDAKKHAIIEDDDQDELVQTYIEAAREHVEETTRRQLVEATHELVLAGFPCEARFKIPRPPLIEVVSIVYLDTAGEEQTLAETEYVVDAPAGSRCPPGSVRLAVGKSWPATLCVEEAVRVRFRAGYRYQDPETEEWSGTVPARLRQAIMVGVAESFKQREETIQGTISTNAMNTIDRLVGGWIVKELDWA